MLFAGRAGETKEESRWAKATEQAPASPWARQKEEAPSRWSKPTEQPASPWAKPAAKPAAEQPAASPWAKQAEQPPAPAAQPPATRGFEEVENVGDEIWDALSLLAQQRVEAVAEADPETPVSILADDTTTTQTSALLEAAHKHPLVARMMASGPSAPEVPFDERKNVILLREAYQGSLDGTLSRADYRAKMEQLLQLSTVAVMLCKNPRIKREKDKLPADEQAVIDRMRLACDKLKAGIDKMWRYVNSGSASDLEKGYREASTGMWDLYLTQQEAHRKEQEIDRRVAEGSYGLEADCNSNSNSQWARS